MSNSFTSGSKVSIASVDSVVMAHLFHLAGYSCAVAHCNFSLRGDESDGDEEFVKKLAVH
jgi:tRNA(Ile)-lysidine synthase